MRQAVAEKTALGQQVGDVINQGRLVPDDLIISVIEERISGAMKSITVHVPVDRLARLAWIYDHTEVVERTDNEDGSV